MFVFRRPWFILRSFIRFPAGGRLKRLLRHPNHEPTLPARQSRQHDHAVAHTRLCPRHDYCAGVRCGRCDRCLFHRLQTAQPAAAHFRRRRVRPSLRANTGGIQANQIARSHARIRPPHRGDADLRAHHRNSNRRVGRTVDYSRHGDRFCQQARQTRTLRRPAADNVPLYPVDFAVIVCRLDTQHLPQVPNPRLHAGAAEPVVHRLRPVPRTLLRPADYRAGMGGVCRRRVAARIPTALAGQTRVSQPTQAGL